MGRRPKRSSATCKRVSSCQWLNATFGNTPPRKSRSPFQVPPQRSANSKICSYRISSNSAGLKGSKVFNTCHHSSSRRTAPRELKRFFNDDGGGGSHILRVMSNLKTLQQIAYARHEERGVSRKFLGRFYFVQPACRIGEPLGGGALHH